jgi:PHD/YefM family antitoxin component YafN of YafNO toxin-antitoxin module
MTRKFSELRAKMTPEARAESAKVSAALRTEFPQHQRQRASMVVTTISSREFNQDTSRAKKAAQDGPVFITDSRRPAHVLMTFQDYQRLTGNPCASQTLADLLAMPGAEDIDFEPPRLQGPLARPPDLS